jgi:hypothetical protein
MSSLFGGHDEAMALDLGEFAAIAARNKGLVPPRTTGFSV